MDCIQTNFDELKTGKGQWRVVIGATIAGIAAFIVVCLVYGVAIKFGLVSAKLVAIILVIGLALIPFYLSAPIQKIADKMFAPPEICLTGDDLISVLPSPFPGYTSYISTPPVAPPRCTLA